MVISLDGEQVCQVSLYWCLFSLIKKSQIAKNTNTNIWWLHCIESGCNEGKLHSGLRKIPVYVPKAVFVTKVIQGVQWKYLA